MYVFVIARVGAATLGCFLVQLRKNSNGKGSDNFCLRSALLLTPARTICSALGALERDMCLTAVPKEKS